MKKTILITLIIGVIINVVVNIFIPEETIGDLVVLYVYFPICFLVSGYIFKNAGVKDSSFIASVIISPVFLGFGAFIFYESNPDLYFQWIYRTPLVAILFSVIILEYKTYKLILKK